MIVFCWKEDDEIAHDDDNDNDDDNSLKDAKYKPAAWSLAKMYSCSCWTIKMFKTKKKKRKTTNLNKQKGKCIAEISLKDIKSYCCAPSGTQ